MIANMNEKGRQTKLLAAIAILAMVVCVFAVVMPSEQADAQTEPDVIMATGNVSDAIGNYYVDADTSTGTTADATITVKDASTATIYAEAGAVISLTPADGQSVVLYVASGWKQTSEGNNVPINGTVTYDENTKVTITGPSSDGNAITVTVNSYGFSINGGTTTDYVADATAVAFKPADGTTIEYYNSKVIGIKDVTDEFNMQTGGSISIPASTIITGSFTVSTGTENNEVFTPKNTLAFEVGDVAGENNPDAFTVGTTPIAINNASGTLTISTASWTTGTMIMKTGSASVSASGMEFVKYGLEAVATNNIATAAAGVIYPDISNYVSTGSGVMILFGDKTYTGTVDANTIHTFRVADSVFDGKIEYSDANYNYSFSVVATETGNSGSIFTNSTITITGALNESNTGSNIIVDGLTIKPINNAVVAEAEVNATGVAFGTMVLSYNIIMGSDSVIPVGSTVTFAQGGQIDLKGYNLYLLGGVSSQTSNAKTQIVNSSGNGQAENNSTVFTTNASSISNYIGNYVVTGAVTHEITLGADNTGIAAELEQLPSGTVVKITASNTTTQNTIPVTGAYTWNGLTINLTGSNPITFQLNSATSLVLNNVTIDDQTGKDSASIDDLVAHQDSLMDVKKGAAITINNSMLYLVVNLEDGASQTLNNEGVEYINTTSNVKVGYGTILTLRDSVSVNTIDVYGTLVVAGSVTIPATQYMAVHDNGTVSVTGTLTISGSAYFEDGSETTVDGTMNIGVSNESGAIADVNGKFTVSTEGTLNVVAGVIGDMLSYNVLQAPGQNDDNKLEVYGTLNMRSQMTGYIQDYGTVTINGTTVGDAGVVVYDGVSLSVRSVTGTLVVTDKGICDKTIEGKEDYMFASTGNSISLSYVSNVTVAVDVDVLNYTSSGQNYRAYRAVMNVYGTVGAVETDVQSATSSVTVSNTSVSSVGPAYNQMSAYIAVPEGQTLTFGTNVSWVVNDLIVVDGSVNFAKGATNDSKTISTTSAGNGVVTVNGTVTVTNHAAIEGLGIAVNGVKYETMDDTTGITTYTYTNFADALDAASNAEEQTIYILGEVSVSADDEIPADVTVTLIGGAELTIEEGVTLTLADDAYMAGPDSVSIIVDGTFIAQDYQTDFHVNDIQADVMSTAGTVRTWTSLYNAINELGWTDITLNRAVVIDEDLTIPAETTVTTNVAPVTVNNNTYSILVSGATLTVEGTLDMQSGSNGALKIVNTASDDGEVVVTGTLMRTVLSGTELEDLSGSVAGVYFAISNGAYVTNYITNMANAGTIVSATTNLVDGVSTYGNVSAQDASFAVTEDGTGYTITVESQSIVSMNTLTLGAGITFTVSLAGNAVAKTMFTGTVSAAGAVVDLSRVSDITFESYSEMGIETTYGLAVYGTVNGTVTVTDGTLDVGYDNSRMLTVADNSTFAVESGATLNIASGMALALAEDVEIAGTIIVANASGITAALNSDVTLTIAGTMDVDVNNFSTGVTLVVTGTLNVLDDNTMNVSEKMVIGAAPETLGVGGALTGSYNITADYILAYAGADLSGAQINWNPAMNQSNAQSTVYHVNGTEYATVYANGGVGINSIFGYVGDSNRTWTEINLAGWDNLSADFVMNGSSNTYAYQWYTADGQKATGNIGSVDAVYIEFDLAQVTGTISKDAGIILTIDDLVIGNVNGDVSQTVKYPLSVGTHTIAWSERTGYNIENVTVTFNGQAVENGGTITITADMTDYTIIAQGAVPGAAPGGDSGSGSTDDGMGLTDYLLIVLVILIVVMAIMVAVRLMRS